MSLQKLLSVFLIFLFSLEAWTQQSPALSPAPAPSVESAKDDKREQGPEKPNGKRIRRQLGLIVGIDHDEEFLIPDVPLTVGGRSEFFDINRIKGTDYFRITPKKAGNGITTLKDTKTKQILVEIRFDIRDDSIEKTLREVQAMLVDIEGIEFKLVNGMIYIDGYVLIPHDLIRIAQVVSTFKDRVLSLAVLSPIARKKIADFISNDINNPEVKVTAVGEFFKLEGQVNSQAEKDRVKQIVALYIPDMVIDQAPNDGLIKVVGRKNPTDVSTLIIDLITIKRDDEKVEPPPKMIQIVAHFVKFGDNYKKSFSFRFSPFFSAQGVAGAPSTSTVTDTINLLNNLLPKLNWDKTHGFAKILDTASILIQDKVTGNISRKVEVPGPTIPGTANSPAVPTTLSATVSLKVTPTIKSERSGLIELKNLEVSVSNLGGDVEKSTDTKVSTTISVRDRQSAAFGGIIKKGTETSFGAPANEAAIITMNAGKKYGRDNSQFVVFITPIIKSSASSGVEQVKKKFRLKD